VSNIKDGIRGAIKARCGDGVEVFSIVEMGGTYSVAVKHENGSIVMLSWPKPEREAPNG
jgi:hypothetical protein